MQGILITVKKERVMANPFVHVELMTSDVAKAKAFYSGLFDWKLEDVPGMDYTMINVGEGTGGGMMKTVQPDSPSCWMSYVAVDDVAVATEKARSLGATICKEVTEIPVVGWFSIITDPSGAIPALWQMNIPAGSLRRERQRRRKRRPNGPRCEWCVA
jgi:predicted enzyme related to lactoylglutathione lyase